MIGLADRDIIVQPDESVPLLRHWFCHIFYIEGRKCLLCTQAATLFSFVVPDVRAADLRPFGEFFRARARAAFLEEDLNEDQIGRLVDDGPDIYSKTDNRAVLGSMNDHVKCSKYLVEMAGGLSQMSPREWDRYLNRTPMSYIDGDNGRARLEDALRRVS